MKSIVQIEKKCYLSGQTLNLDKHHIFFGSNRRNSEKYGLWVWLNHYYHIQDSGLSTPHNNRETDLHLKRLAQRKFEEVHGSRGEFMRIFGRNYLED